MGGVFLGKGCVKLSPNFPGCFFPRLAFSSFPFDTFRLKASPILAEKRRLTRRKWSGSWEALPPSKVGWISPPPAKKGVT